MPLDLGAGCREHRGRPLAELADWLCWQLSKCTKGLRDTHLQWQGAEPDWGAAVWEKIPLSKLKTRKKNPHSAQNKNKNQTEVTLSKREHWKKIFLESCLGEQFLQSLGGLLTEMQL